MALASTCNILRLTSSLPNHFQPFCILGTILLATAIILVFHQPPSPTQTQYNMASRRVYQICRKAKTVTSEMERDPRLCPGRVFRELYETPCAEDKSAESSESSEVEAGSSVGNDSGFHEMDELEKARACGKWGSSEPSELFLKIYHDALCTLESNPASGVVSPPLMGTTGVLPLTIVGTLPDLCRHLANCIARAEHEVFLLTNFWIHSDASTLVTNSMKELSRRAGERGRRVVMRMVYDRGDVRQTLEPRLNVPESQYTSSKVRLPSSDEIPNIDLQVINYHRPIFGTFHAKFAVIDRRIALLQSSNIQDNDNLEMLAHFEGPVVDSFYDAALLSWGRPVVPMAFGGHRQDAHFAEKEGFSENGIGRKSLPELTTASRHYDIDLVQEARRVNSVLIPRGGETPTQAVTRYLNTTIQPDTIGTAPDSTQDPRMTPYFVLPRHEPFPIALVNREPYGAPNHSSTHTPQNAAFLSAITHAKETIFIQTPNLNAEPLLEALLDAVRRGVTVTAYLCLGYNDAGELLPFQNGTNEMVANRLYNSLHTAEEKARLKIYYYVGKDQIRPIHNRFKRRSCHIKLLVVDGRVAVQGNGNLDTQSFFHSQEINVLLDSEMVCQTWLEMISRNQNTAVYGVASSVDGCWHDPSTGEISAGSIGVHPGPFSWVRGVVGAVQRVRGAGGF